MKIPFIVTACLSALFLLSCEEETIFRFDSSTEPEYIPSNDEGGDLNNFTILRLYVNKPWVAKSNQSWCIVSPSSGDGSDKWPEIFVSFDKNTTYEERCATVTIQCEEYVVTKDYIQYAAPYLNLPQAEYVITSDAQQVAIKIETTLKDYEIRIESSQSWAKYSETKGILGKDIIINVSKNQTKFSRDCKIIISETWGLSPIVLTAIIKQNGQQ